MFVGHLCSFSDVMLPVHRFNFEPGSHLILAGTIQFASSIQLAKQQLAGDYPSLVIPQSKPLSPGQQACTHSLQTGRIMPSLMQTSNAADLCFRVCMCFQPLQGLLWLKLLFLQCLRMHETFYQLVS